MRTRIVTFIGGPADLQRHGVPDDGRRFWEIATLSEERRSWRERVNAASNDTDMCLVTRYELCPVYSHVDSAPVWVGRPA